MTRNLIYHIYPAAGNPVWLWNLRLMVEHIHHFDRVIVGVATGDGTVPASTISYHLRGHPRIEFVLAKNDPRKGELTTMPTMLEMVKSDREDEATFYAHAKGITRTDNRLEAVKCWVRAMYDLNFNLEWVENLLKTHACAGAFRRGGPDDEGPIGNKYRWHYSGNFWWVKHSELFKLDWQKKLKGPRHAAENFLGELFPIEKAACTGVCEAMPLYHLRAWEPPNGEIYRAMQAFAGP